MPTADDSILQNLERAASGERLDLTEFLEQIPFDAAGLIPAIAQDADSERVLMLAWMDRHAIERTLAEGLACYYSRSRAQYWRKGETSGNLQALVSMAFDCDADSVLLRVNQTGPACHTNRTSCYYLEVSGDSVVVNQSWNQPDAP